MTSHGPPRRVLLVDDNETDRLLTAMAFDALDGGFTLVTAASGEEAVAVCCGPQATRPDLVLLDLHMPGMNGFDVLDRLKSDRQLCTVPVVVFTTSEEERDRIAAYQRHASAYLVKPSHFDDMVTQLRSLMAFWRLTVVPHAAG